jgi:hypothetical protein
MCGCRSSGDGLCWRATRSRNSRPELICGRRDGARSSRRVCNLGSGPTIGRRHGPAPGFGFDFETTSDQIDSAMPQKRILGVSVLFVAAGKEWRGNLLRSALYGGET